MVEKQINIRFIGPSPKVVKKKLSQNKAHLNPSKNSQVYRVQWNLKGLGWIYRFYLFNSTNSSNNAIDS